jgi:predicted molibdopterin-dependent oxidoreductase YjgC
LLLNADRNPNSNGARLTGMCADPMGSRLPEIARGIEQGRIKTLLVFGEDVTKHGIGGALLDRLDSLIVSDILANATTERAHWLLPGCAHLEKRGTFTNVKGRVQRFMKAVEPPGDARPEWQILHELVFNATGQDGYRSIEGLFNHMTNEVPAFKGLTWAALGDVGVTVTI